MVNRKLLIGVILALGVILPGLAKNILTKAGYGTLGTAAWIAGYGAAVLVVWYVFVRPIDIGNTDSS